MSIYGNLITESILSVDFCFYHMVPKGSNINIGITSLDYQYKNDIKQFRENSSKYRDRLCNGWDIYPGRDPNSLTDKEVYDGINKFRKSNQGCNQIYMFKFPPYKTLGVKMKRILNSKDIYKVNLDCLKNDKIIASIDWGYIDSFTGNEKLSEEYYRSITPEEYFRNYKENDSNRLLFSYLNHISVVPIKGYIPKRYLEKINTPNTIDEIE